MRPLGEQTILITGATDGLGRAVARALAERGARLLLHGRNDERGEATIAELAAATGNNKLHYYRADFTSLSEVRELAARVATEHSRIDVLLNNAALGIDPTRRITADGLEATFQVDYLAPYMLDYLLEGPTRGGGTEPHHQRRLGRPGAHQLRRHHARAKL